MQKLIPLDSRRRKSFRTRLQALRAGLTTLARDRRGEGYLDMAMKILIVVVIGAAILAIMNTAMPNQPDRQDYRRTQQRHRTALTYRLKRALTA